MKTLYYALVNNNGNFIITDGKLPIYWNRYIAERESVTFNAKVKKINITDLKSLLKELN